MQKDAPSPSQDLEDMQSLLYLTEEADAQLRNGNYAMALKKYTAIQKVCPPGTICGAYRDLFLCGRDVALGL